MFGEYWECKIGLREIIHLKASGWAGEGQASARGQLVLRGIEVMPCYGLRADGRADL